MDRAYEIAWQAFEQLEEKGVEVTEDVAVLMRAVAENVADAMAAFEARLDSDERAD